MSMVPPEDAWRHMRRGTKEKVVDRYRFTAPWGGSAKLLSDAILLHSVVYFTKNVSTHLYLWPLPVQLHAVWVSVSSAGVHCVQWEEGSAWQVYMTSPLALVCNKILYHTTSYGVCVSCKFSLVEPLLGVFKHSHCNTSTTTPEWGDYQRVENQFQGTCKIHAADWVTGRP